MALHPLAGRPAPTTLLIDVARLEREYYARPPDLSSQQIVAGALARPSGDSAKKKKDGRA